MQQTFWKPNADVVDMLVKMCQKNNYTKILENGPGETPFPLSTHFIDIDSRLKNTIAIDIDFDKIPFENEYFDFCYARHIFEDIQNPQHAFSETVRICKSGYIETPSPLIECLKMVDSLSREKNINYCGYIHHRYIVWTDIETNTLYFLPKYPFLEYLEFEPDFYKYMLEMSKEKFYWNNYYLWMEKNQKPKIFVYRNGVNFNILEDYKDLVMTAIKKSIASTKFHFFSEQNTDNPLTVDINYTNPLYKTFLDKSKINTILEIGSRDGLYAISLSKEYPDSHIYSFECNPLTIDICRLNIQNSQQKNISFYDFALGKDIGKLPFYSYVKDSDTPFALESSGSSSFFKRDDFIQTQKYTKDVDVMRVDKFCNENNIKKIDLICMDVQGFELNILKGCGDLIHTIDYIILEVTKPGLISVYNLSPSYQEVNDFMTANGFEKSLVIEENRFEDNILYTKKNISNQI